MNSIRKKIYWGKLLGSPLRKYFLTSQSVYVTYGKFIWEVQNLRVFSRLLYVLKLNRQLLLVDLAGWVN